ncbi:MAG TPA: NAD-binding protein, partial [Candidatus Dormibacteraeota bacterium]
AAALKLLSNAMLHVSFLAAGELMAAARRSGLDPAAVFRLLCTIMPYLESRSRAYLERAYDRPMFQLSGAVKDQGLALDLGRAHGAAMPLLAVSREIYAMAEPQHGNEETIAVLETYPQ